VRSLVIIYTICPFLKVLSKRIMISLILKIQKKDLIFLDWECPVDLIVIKVLIARMKKNIICR